jgi:hypothetical protein
MAADKITYNVRGIAALANEARENSTLQRRALSNSFSDRASM